MTHEILADADKKFQSTLDYFKSELATIRSSHTSPALVEDIQIEAYDGKYPLKEMAAISVPEPTLILIQPWDNSVIPAIQTGILEAQIGLTPNVDGNTIRLNVPPLSEERRNEMIKRVGVKAEEARVAIRNIRQEKMKSIDDLEENDKISEDERDRARKEIQTDVDKCNAEVEKIREAKEKTLVEF